jgi:hypothetical protein
MRRNKKARVIGHGLNGVRKIKTLSNNLNRREQETDKNSNNADSNHYYDSSNINSIGPYYPDHDVIDDAAESFCDASGFFYETTNATATRIERKLHDARLKRTFLTDLDSMQRVEKTHAAHNPGEISKILTDWNAGV